MEADAVWETLGCNGILMWLIVQENFIASGHSINVSMTCNLKQF